MKSKIQIENVEFEAVPLEGIIKFSVSVDHGDSERTTLIQAISVDDALQVAMLLAHSAGEARRRSLPTWEPVRSDQAGRVLVAHQGTSRWFRRSSLRRTRTCQKCRRTVEDTGYREHAPIPWANPNWRAVVLCPSCCTVAPVEDLGAQILGALKLGVRSWER